MVKGRTHVKMDIKANVRPFYRQFDADALKQALKRMYLIRRFEEGAEEAYMRGLIHGTMHLSIGQEASAVGATMALRHQRLHHLHPSRPRPLHRQGRRSQADVRRVLRQGRRLLPRTRRLHAHRRRGDRQSGRQRHRGRRHAHRGRRRTLAIKKQKRDDVAMCFFGDGATNEGAFHEALNMAAIWKLPVVFVCENNKYGMSVSTERSMAVPNVADRASAYGMPGVIVDGNADCRCRGGRAFAAADRARAGEGPTPHRVQDLPHPRPFAQRPQPLPHQGRDRGVEVARPHSALRGRTAGPWRCDAETRSPQSEREAEAEIAAGIEFARNGTDPRSGRRHARCLFARRLPA